MAVLCLAFTIIGAAPVAVGADDVLEETGGGGDCHPPFPLGAFIEYAGNNPTAPLGNDEVLRIYPDGRGRILQGAPCEPKRVIKRFRVSKTRQAALRRFLPERFPSAPGRSRFQHVSRSRDRYTHLVTYRLQRGEYERGWEFPATRSRLTPRKQWELIVLLKRIVREVAPRR